MNTAPYGPSPTPAPTAWYHDGVHYCIENGLMEGYGNNLFGPDNLLSRAMLAQILYNRAGVTDSGPFTDVAARMWYTDAVAWAAAAGVAGGYGNSLFGSNDSITREQLAVMLYRYAQQNGGGFTGNWLFRPDFTDAADVFDWAYEAMCWCSMNGIVTGKGDGILDPKGETTCAEAAAMLQRFFENL